MKSENRKTRRHQTRPYLARQDGSLRMQKCKVSSNQSSRACEILNLGFVVSLSLSSSVLSLLLLLSRARRCLSNPISWFLFGSRDWSCSTFPNSSRRNARSGRKLRFSSTVPVSDCHREISLFLLTAVCSNQYRRTMSITFFPCCVATSFVNV